MDKLSAELAECRQRGEQIQAVGEDAPLSARIEARSMRLAVQAETEDLEERVRLALRVTDPLVVAVAAGQRELKAAQANLDDLTAAIKTPFFSARGRATQEWATYQIRSGAWLDDGGPGARAVMDHALKVTGYGDKIQRDAIAAYLAGDPVARSVAGSVQHLPDGRTLTMTPDGLPVLVDNGATPQGLASVPASPQGHGPTGAEVLAGLRSGSGWPEPAPAVTKAQEPRQRARGWWGLDGALDWASR